LNAVAGADKGKCILCKTTLTNGVKTCSDKDVATSCKDNYLLSAKGKCVACDVNSKVATCS